MTGSSTQGIKTVLHPVSDLASAKAVYAALLGVPPQTDGSYYVGFEAEGQHIGLLPGGGPQGMTSPVAYDHYSVLRTIEDNWGLTQLGNASCSCTQPMTDLLAP